MASLQPMSGVLGMTNAKHLLRRTTYNITKERIDTFASTNISAAVDELFNFSPLTMDEPIDYITGQTFINSGIAPNLGDTQQRRAVKAWWMHQAFLDTSIRHKMMFFRSFCRA